MPSKIDGNILEIPQEERSWLLTSWCLNNSVAIAMGIIMYYQNGERA